MTVGTSAKQKHNLKIPVMPNQNPIILNYEDSLLRKSDIELLKGPHWLNDNIISFYLEYLRNTTEGAPHILFVAPEVTQCIKITPTSQLDIFLEPLQAREKDFIFFALNDNDSPQSAGGSHWSLLVYSSLTSRIHHFDSSTGSNKDQAKRFATKLFKYFAINGEFIEEVSMQQSNGYDCGIFLISNVENLTRHLLEHHKIDGYNSRLSLNNVHNMRNEIVQIIEGLKNS